jgi:V/A-type H+-transporting ATPase subunit I
LPDRFALGFAEFHRIGSKIDFETIYSQANELDSGLINNDSAVRSLENDKAALLPWAGLDVAFKELSLSGNVKAMLGRARGTSAERIIGDIAETAPLADVTIVNQIDDTVYFAVIHQAHYSRDLEALFTGLGVEVFEPIQSGRAADEIKLIDDRLAELREKRRGLEEEAKQLLRYEKELRILEDWLNGQLFSHEVQERFGGTRSVFILDGWVEAPRAEEVTQLLRSESRVVDFSFADPAPGDRVPTVLRNRRWSRPFEVLTRLYGVPNYHEIDPTPFIGIFFCLFFGMALGDAGYGLVLAGFCLWLRRRLLLTDAGRQWMDIFILGGVLSILVGIVTGSYFGLPVESLPAFMRKLILIDPLRQALLFLLITLALGAIHVVLGMALEFWDDWRKAQYSDAVYVSLPRLAVGLAASAVSTAWVMMVVLEVKSPVFVTMLAVSLKALGWAVVFYIFSSGGAISSGLEIGRDLISPTERENKRNANNVMAALALVVIAAATVSLIPWRWPAILIALIAGLGFSAAFRRTAVAFGSGLYNVYGMTSFLNDVWSYSRLMALGLATFLIGFVINIMAGLVAGATVAGIPIGILLALVIAVPLHAANLIINLLGAFVHPLRLQFVEFFSQFYENGGHPFKPFAFETEHLIFLKEE